MTRVATALFVLLLCLAAPFAQAQEVTRADLPARFTVTGLRRGEDLNIRERPTRDSRTLATLQPGATGVEVIGLSRDGEWGLVPFGERSGWTRMRYLARERAGTTPLPRPLFCRGTEPSWALTVPARGGASFDTVPLRRHGEVAGSAGGVMAFDMDGQTLDLTVVRRRCSDGMSDRPYGYTALVWDRGETLLEGCCTLTSR